MNRKFNIFAEINGKELFYEMILAESNRPILFVCADAENHRFICSCHCANREKSEWLVAPIDRKTLLKLLTNQLPIRDAFTAAQYPITVVTQYPKEPFRRYRRVSAEEVSDEMPTAGYYMDAEPNEFSEEIAKLENEEKLDAEYIVRYVVRSAVYTILLPEVDFVKEETFLHTS